MAKDENRFGRNLINSEINTEPLIGKAQINPHFFFNLRLKIIIDALTNLGCEKSTGSLTQALQNDALCLMKIKKKGLS